MKTRNVLIILIIVTGYLFSGCSPRARYKRMLKHELSSGVRYDSIFMGIYLGMPEKTFYTRCWDLNKRGIVRQGPTNTTVQYEIKKELKYPALMNFYPRFTNGNISEMPVKFSYKGWAPWNKKLSSDNLELDVLRWYEEVYGEGFIKVRHPKYGAAYIKVNGNRRITIFKESDIYVWAVFTDLSVKKDDWANSTTDTTNISTDIKKPE